MLNRINIMQRILLVIAFSASMFYIGSSQAQEITVYKSPTCGCCKKWITHLENNGFKVKAQDMQNVTPKKIEFGITPQTASCHTAVVDGYVIEGHVPAEDIKRLLKDKPKDVTGLTVPGMPVGSPGMEMGDRKDPYNVLAIGKDGRTSVYANH
ncbi:MAG: DUF411 domain-containing protein [Gammaproteobacteria bacterium]|nr:DUF411 domain-containing protein [Gammaproteobacteria bacterium]MDH5650597.1 DUF411 domain-containing protein [Gammaproteobacteria bacterium]